MIPLPTHPLDGNAPLIGRALPAPAVSFVVKWLCFDVGCLSKGHRL